VTGINLAAFAARQDLAELVQRASEHGITGHDVVGNGIVHELVGGEDLHVTGADLSLINDALHAAEMIDMGMCIDDRDYRPSGTVLEIEFHCSFGGLHRRQGIDDDQTVVGLHERHIGIVEAAYLVEPVGHLEETVEVVELRLTPEARIDGRWGVPRDERIRLHRPDLSLAVGRDDAIWHRCNEPTLSFLEVAAIAERQ